MDGASRQTQMPARLPELLAPAGGPDAFAAALAGGADAIYCGFGNDFNARRAAQNFDEKSFAAACRQAHLAGTRVYVTLNVVIQEDEMDRALALVRHVWELGADAVIIQDWGLLARVREELPQVEVHVSTQANVHDARGTAWCAGLGATRVTLSRELSMDEIAACAATGVDVECFGHGALCFCYSGVCLLSSMVGGRSANRGQCAQPCRLPYDLVDGAGKTLLPHGDMRPLCPRDCNSLDWLGQMAAAGVASLKVEGRMKAPDYVLAVVGAYREALDRLALGDERGAWRAGVDRRLKRAFNRDFTDAYLRGESDNRMMSYERSNNRGQLAGTVVGSRGLPSVRERRGGGDGGRERGRTRTRAEVTLLLSEPVGKGDLLELRPDDDPSAFLTVTADADHAAGEKITCVAARPMPKGCPVRVIRSQAALDEAARVAGADVPRKRLVDVAVTARLGEPFRVTLTTADGRFCAGAEGPVVEAARTRELGEKDLAEHVCRMGTSAFEPRNVKVELDAGCGMAFGAVHAVRADACTALERAILAEYDARRGEERRDVTARRPVCHNAQVEACALVTTPEAARAALEAGAARVYATADDLATGTWPQAVVPVLDEVCREPDHARLDPWVRSGEPVAVGNVSELALAARRGAAAEVRPCIPAHNVRALTALLDAGASRVWLSPELTLEQIRTLAAARVLPLGLVVAGRTRVMTSEHCVLQAAGHCIHDCAACELRRQQPALRSIDGDLFPVRTDLHGRSRIYFGAPLDLTPQVGELVAAGVGALAVDGTLMDADEVAQAVARLVAATDAAAQGKRPSRRLLGTTSGHLFRGIG